MSMKRNPPSSTSTTQNNDGLSASMITAQTLTKKERIKVVVRVKSPLIKGSKKCVFAINNKTIILEEKGKYSSEFQRDKSLNVKKNTFTFDSVFDENASQEDVYNFTTKCLINEVVSGYNGMVFAYGATGSGKTYTMMAMNYKENSGSINISESGIIIQAFKDLFSIIEEQSERFIITLSYMEIYNENIRDLFNKDSNFLELRGNNNVQIIGLSEIVVTSPQQAINLLHKGNETRSMRYTGANCVSSRSHAVLVIVLRQSTEQQDYERFINTRQSKLLFVDLAGSERAKHTKNKGKRLQEGGHINKSLLALGNCISALCNGTKAQHVNFRDSKLTRLLKEPLSGNYQTIMIAQVNPLLEFIEESKNTLTYATKAMGISKQIRRNVNVSCQVPLYQNLIVELRDEITRLKSKIKEENNGNKILNENDKAMQLKNEIIALFEEKMKLRRQLLDIDSNILFLKTEIEKQNQLMSYWQSKNNKLYRFKNSTKNINETNMDRSIEENIRNITSNLDSIENEKDHYFQLRSEIEEKLKYTKQRAVSLENELHVSVDEEAEKELLLLFCRVNELETDKLSIQGDRMMDAYELHRSEQLLNRYQEQQKISDRIITKQRQLIEEKKISMPSDLQSLYNLYQQEIHAITLQNKDFNNTIDQINFPDVERSGKSFFTINNESKFKRKADSWSDSSQEWSIGEPVSDDNKSPVHFPKVDDIILNIENDRSLNPSPIPPAVLFPPITF
ncbi:hypothetical protein PGB90_006394 [Kerria lacca]